MSAAQEEETATEKGEITTRSLEFPVHMIQGEFLSLTRCDIRTRAFGATLPQGKSDKVT